MTSVEKSATPVENVQNAWRILANGSVAAARALVEIAEFGQSEAARNQASMAILDRVGLGAKPELTVRVIPAEYDDRQHSDGGLTPGEIVRARLLELRQATQEEAERKAQEESEIIEAELVPEPGF